MKHAHCIDRQSAGEICKAWWELKLNLKGGRKKESRRTMREIKWREKKNQVQGNGGEHSFWMRHGPKIGVHLVESCLNNYPVSVTI